MYFIERVKLQEAAVDEQSEEIKKKHLTLSFGMCGEFKKRNHESRLSHLVKTKARRLEV